MTIKVKLTKEIINESLPIFYRYTSFKQKYLPFLLPTLFIGFITYLQIRDVYAKQSKPVSLRYVSFIFLLVFIKVVWDLYKRNRVGKMVMEQLGEDSNYTVEVNNDKLLFVFASRKLNKMWTDYPKAVVAKNVVIFYQSGGSYITFYHTFFTNDDFIRFKQMVYSNIDEVKEV